MKPTQITRLDQLESTIAGGQKAFVEVGNALHEIRESKLYLRDYATFESYCQGRWGWTRQHGARLIQAAALVESLPPTLAAVVETERDARALADLEPAHQKEAIREAKKEGVPVSEIAKSYSEKPVNIGPPVSPVGDKQEKDSIGYTIPKALLPLWERRGDVTALLARVTSLKTELLRVQESKDDLFLTVNISAAVSRLEYVHQEISAARLHAVCPTCNGRTPPKGCHCKGRGILSKHAWDTGVPDEIKQMRSAK